MFGFQNQLKDKKITLNKNQLRWKIDLTGIDYPILNQTQIKIKMGLC